MTEKKNKTRKKVEFGDFQTPLTLTRIICSLLSKRGVEPTSILEPTCGQGSFLIAALEAFPNVEKVFGLDINSHYVNTASTKVRATPGGYKAKVVQGDFFKTDWSDILLSLPDPLLIIGNPPWVTNSELGGLGSSNLPRKSNFQNRRGIDAITGQSNFDISEWMILQAIGWMGGHRATLAMLCKTTVARKVLLHTWKSRVQNNLAEIYRIDAPKYFGATVDACLLIINASPTAQNFDCTVYNKITEGPPTSTFGYRDDRLIANVNAYKRWKHLEGKERYKWRSGIKHDCAKLMELRTAGDLFRNGFGERVDLEKDYLFPMLKSSELANGSNPKPLRWMLVTQRHIGEDTESIRWRAPKTWEYLCTHSDFLDRRASVIYKNKPCFSIFGIGEYSFAPWKVAISGLYKKLIFRVVGPVIDKPVVLDDTCYFIACRTEKEARFIESLLNSETAREFYSAYIFWDAKRPITAEHLRRLDILTLAKELGLEDLLKRYISQADQTPRLPEQVSLLSYS